MFEVGVNDVEKCYDPLYLSNGSVTKCNYNYHAFIIQEWCQSTDSTEYPSCVINSFFKICGVLIVVNSHIRKCRDCRLRCLGFDRDPGLLTTFLLKCKQAYLHVCCHHVICNRVCMSTYAALLGTRVGEADNPGPKEKT